MGAPLGMYFHGTAIGFVEHHVRFLAPVRPGDTLTTTWTIVDTRDKPKHAAASSCSPARPATRTARDPTPTRKMMVFERP